MRGKAKVKESLQNFTLKTIPIAQIKRAKYNPRRKFTEAELKSFEADMEHFSCVLPLVWNERTGNLVGGHKRLDWLEKKGAKTVQVAVVSLDEKEEKLLNLALNRQGEGLWDEEKLEITLEELKLEEDVSLDITGFEADTVLDEFEVETPAFQSETKTTIKIVCKRTDVEAIKKELDALILRYPGSAYYAADV